MCILVLQLATTLSSCDMLLALVAAVTHDLDHPGVNQGFLVRTGHHLAALYKVGNLWREAHALAHACAHTHMHTHKQGQAYRNKSLARTYASMNTLRRTHALGN